MYLFNVFPKCHIIEQKGVGCTGAGSNGSIPVGLEVEKVDVTMEHGGDGESLVLEHTPRTPSSGKHTLKFDTQPVATTQGQGPPAARTDLGLGRTPPNPPGACWQRIGTGWGHLHVDPWGTTRAGPVSPPTTARWAEHCILV